MKKIILGLSFMFLTVLVACVSQQYTVTFNTNGGTPEIDDVKVEADELLLTPTEITKTGYTFNGWYKNQELTEQWTFETDKVKSDMTLFAKWDLVPVETINITFDSDGGSSVNTLKLAKDSLITLPDTPTKEGYVFSGWYKNESLTQPWNFTEDLANSNTLLKAKWKLESDHMESFKILSIGNSFSEDAHRYLYDIAKSYGIDEANIVIANMYIGGAELVQHFNNSATNAKNYQYQLFKNGVRTNTNSMSMGDAIASEVWDVITFQQASHHSGMQDKYNDYLLRLTRWVDSLTVNPDVKIGWHMTWAYQQTSNHSGFANYNNNQQTMYNMIVETTNQKVLSVPQVQFVIPSGTAIQNARTSYIGDRLTHDGYHLTDPLGRYIAGLMYFKQITGFEVSQSKIAFKPTGVSETDQLMAMEAVNNAFVKPYIVTESTFNDAPVIEPIETTGVQLEFDFVQGFWADNATSVSPETDAIHKNYAAVMPIPKALLPVGSEIVIEPGYQYRVIFLEKNGDNFKVVSRTGNTSTQYVMIDEAFWGNHQYVAFNISSVPTVDISNNLAEAASKLKLYNPEGTGEGHIDLELTFELGYWQLDGTQLVNSNNHISSKPLTPSFFQLGNFISVQEGFEYSIASLVYDNGYKVVGISDFTIEKQEINNEFTLEHEIIVIIVKRIDDSSIDTDIQLVVSIKPNTVVHMDQDMFFTQGFWADNATSILTEDTDFNKRFMASNIMSKLSFMSASSFIVEEGYQVRVVYLSYDGYGNYKVLKRSNNLTGTVLMDETFWGDNQFIAFNLSKLDNSNISLLRDQMPNKINFIASLNFISGYWNNNATSITVGDTTAKSFVASHITGRQTIKPGTIITLATGYQARVIFLSSIDGLNFKVEHRTDNLKESFVLTNALYKNYNYIAFNISKNPTSDITTEVELTGSKISFQPFNEEHVEHVDASLTFVSGYWNDRATSVTQNNTTFDLGFAASNVFSMTSLSAYSSITIAEGYQVRVVFMDYSYNTYSVMLRTSAMGGTIVLTPEQISTYQFVAFNIFTNPSTNLSNELDNLSTKITFNA